MPNIQEAFQEIAVIEQYIAQGYTITEYKEDLYGAHVTWTKGDDVENIDFLTPEARKFMTTHMFAQSNVQQTY